MNSAKIAVFSVLAACAIAAVVGAIPASATVLCKNEECTETYPAGTVIKAELEGTFVLKAGFTNTCTGSTIQAKTSNSGGSTETVAAATETLTFSSCSCPVTVLSKGSLEMHKDPTGGARTGTLTDKSKEMTTNCSGVSCTYGSPEGGDLGTYDPPSLFHLLGRITEERKTKKTEGGFLCSSEATVTAIYQVTSPNPLYIG